MLKGEEQLQLAMLRMQLRAIDAEITIVRRESRRYRQMRFGLDIKEIQLSALQDQRDACVERINELSDRLRLRRERHDHPFAWLLVPIALWLHLQKAFAVRPAAQASPVQPAPAFRLEEVQPLPTERVAVGAGR